MGIKLDFIAGNVVFVDSTKIRASAAWEKSYTKGWYEKQLLEVDQRIEGLLA